MNIFKNKIIFKLIASLCVFLILLNCGVSNIAYANESWGGVFIEPAIKLLTSIADGIMSILHKGLQNQDVAIVEISGVPDWWERWGSSALGTFTTVLGLVVGGLAIYFTGGSALPVVLGAVAIGTGIEYLSQEVLGESFFCDILAEQIASSWFDENLYMPVFTLTPEEIFKNNVLMLDVNFFNPKYTYDTYETSEKPGENILLSEKSVNYIISDEVLKSKSDFFRYIDAETKKFEFWEYYDNILELYESIDHDFTGPPAPGQLSSSIPLTDITDNEFEGINGLLKETFNKVNSKIDQMSEESELYKLYEIQYNKKSVAKEYTVGVTVTYSISDIGDWKIGLDIYVFYKGSLTHIIRYDMSGMTTLPMTTRPTIIGLAPEEIDAMHLPETEKLTIVELAQREYQVLRGSVAYDLKETISKWYFILRNLALLVLMIVLIYIGIRIVLGSTAGEKAKYKERLVDWFVAMCLLFIMQYIMVFAISFSEKILDLVAGVTHPPIVESIQLTDQQLKSAEELEDGTKEDTDTVKAFRDKGAIVEENGSSFLSWTTNLTGRMRIVAQEVHEGTARWVAYSACYIIMVLYTVFFTYTYIKRIVYLAILTIISPLVAMTYPIDKITDGKAQAFNMWIKEYIFNLLMQPLHLLLYTILISMAYTLAAKNPLYAIVSVGFIMPAEKILREFFGFTKAQTPGMLGGAAGAALGFAGLQKVSNLMNVGSGSNAANGKEDNYKEDINGNIKFKENNQPKDENKEDKSTKKEKVRKKQDVKKGNKRKSTKARKKQNATQRLVAMNNNVKAGTNQIKSKRTSENKNNKETSNKKARPRRILRTLGAAAGTYRRRLTRKMYLKAKKQKPIRTLARRIGGIYGAVTLGMAGTLLGVASGDPSKAFQYGTAGIAGGYGLGKRVTGATADALAVDKEKIKDEMDMAKYGEGYKEYKHNKAKEKFIKDDENIITTRKLLGCSRKDAQHILGTTGNECLDAGITDIEDIAAIHEMNHKNNVDINQAIRAQKLSKYIPKDMSIKQRNDYIDRWAKENEDEGYDDPRGIATETMELVELFEKTKSNFKNA